MSDHDTWNMFAAAALQGMCAYSGMATGDTHEVRAFNAAMHADALLVESKKRAPVGNAQPVNLGWYSTELAQPTPPQPDDDGWIKWEGGKCPLASHIRIKGQMRNGEISDSYASEFDWVHRDDHAEWDLTAYRIVSEAGVTK